MNKIRFLFLIIVFTVIGYSALWFTVSFTLEDRIKAEINALQSTGHEILIDKIKVTGFPYRLSVEIDGLDMRTANRGLAVTSPHIRLVTHLWTKDHWVGEMQDGEIELARGRVKIVDSHIRGSLRKNGEQGTGVAIDFTSDDTPPLVYTSSAPDTPVTLKTIFAAIRFGKDEKGNGLFENHLFDFRLRLADATRKLHTTGTLTGPNLANWSEAELETWRDSGGVIEFNMIDYSINQTDIKGSGSLTLDEKLKPLGSFAGTVPNTASLAALYASFGIEPTNNNAIINTGPALTIMLQNGNIIAGEHIVGTLDPVINIRE